MTLIAAFRCAEGVVLCADSQETIGDYRVHVDKIAPISLGAYQAVIGGAGHGQLVDGFAERVSEEMQTWKAGLQQRAIKAKIATLLLDYYRNEVAADPSSPEDKQMRFLFCVRDPRSGRVYLWHSMSSSVITVDRYSLIGWDEAIYKHEVKRLYHENAPALRCILLGVHLFSLGKATSNYIGGPTQIVGLLDTSRWAKAHPKIRQAYELATKSVWVEDPQRVSELEERMTTLDATMSKLLLDCADTTIHSKIFAENLEQFKKRMLELREGYIRNAMYSEIASMEANVGKPAIGVLPPYLEIGAEIVSARNHPLANLLSSSKKNTATPDTTKPRHDTKADSENDPA